jgi:hypothetical protein
MAFTGGGALALATARSLPVLAADGEYEEGKAIPGDYTFEYGTYVSPTDDALYQYATGTDGYAYCSKYEDGEWSDWEQAGDQTVAWDPAPVTYDGKSQAYYTGGDGYIYELTWDSYGDAQWEDVSGGYSFEASPYASTYEDSLHLYGTSTDGYVYHKAYMKDGGCGGVRVELLLRRVANRVRGALEAVLGRNLLRLVPRTVSVAVAVPVGLVVGADPEGVLVIAP